MRKFVMGLAAMALLGITSAQGGHDVAAACEGQAPFDYYCVRRFTAERRVAGIGSEIGWSAGVLRGTITDGERTFDITCHDAVVTGGCGGTLPAEGIPPGATVTLEVYAVGGGGDGFWRVTALYGD